MMDDSRVGWITCLALLAALSMMTAVNAAADTWTDPAGDVTLPNADIISGSTSVFGGLVDFRVRFSAPPFPTTATHFMTWCIDTDRNAATGSACGFSTFLGADRGFTLDGRLGAIYQCGHSLFGNVRGLQVVSQLWFDQADNEFRLVFPLALVSEDASFHYAVESAFGGSFGANERVPDSVDFGSAGGFLSSDIGEAGPFGGALLCGPGLVGIDVKPGVFPNTINPRSGGAIRVAVLTTDSFDAAGVDPTSVRFGENGTEASPLQSSLEDADGDGDLDLVLKFSGPSTGIACGDIAGVLSGKTTAGASIAGVDSIRTVGCN
ncbi:MAG TPA: hypothetical protein VKF61_03350 [Candidatus Polarisedimenticolia bacterium]|nr:hypothetical protein [Candidatus Polarisedimenticolia bacterium]